MPNFKIDDFTSKLTHGGALSSLFECSITGYKGTSDTSKMNDFKYLCKGVTLPASAIETSAVTYMGRSLNIPGNRAAQTITTSVYNDEWMEIRNHIESWMERINSHNMNKRAPGFDSIGSYTGTMVLNALSKDGQMDTKEYEFINVWPSSTGDLTFSWDSNDLQTFDITWEFAYWRSADSTAGYST
tara:strand:- start:841 stop:1398 length:558 start_codon:yes stop_codon:yes gene_type:complete